MIVVVRMICFMVMVMMMMVVLMTDTMIMMQVISRSHSRKLSRNIRLSVITEVVYHIEKTGDYRLHFWIVVFAIRTLPGAPVESEPMISFHMVFDISFVGI
jgi:hypothetical protein